MKPSVVHHDEELQRTKGIVYSRCRVLDDLRVNQSQHGVHGVDLRESTKFVTDLSVDRGHIGECSEREGAHRWGHHYSYWDYFEGDTSFVAPRYESVKDELLLNEAASITMPQFTDLVENAQCLLSTERCRRTRCTDRGGRPYYAMARGERMTLQHLLSVAVYCNFQRLQRAIKAFAVFLNTINPHPVCFPRCCCVK